ncbi:MAG: Rieske (2Fe-2S) protein [Spirochaetaceae bacterium]|nr:Rieske (2Fe-2S) protein [Spirochaetaceae bacterium]
MARHVVGPADAIPPGGRRVLTVAGRSIGIFNVEGRFHALRNSCLHNQAPVCLGEVGATYLPSAPGQYRRGLDGRVLRCPWHGWEYDISTGRNLIDPSRKLTTYPVTVENGDLVVHIGVPIPDALPTAAPSR